MRSLTRAGATPGRFTFTVGKGGTGKSTTAAALAVHLAQHHGRVHLISTDPAPSIADIFNIPRMTPLAQSCEPNLTLEELDAKRITDAFIARVRKPLEEIIEKGTYLDADDIARLTNLTLPGVDELGAALRLAELAGSDAHVVVDTAPTGHTLRLLDSAFLIESWANVFSTMADKVATIAMTMVNARVRMPGEATIEELRATAESFRNAITRAEFIVVTRDGSVVQEETRRLIDELRSRRLQVAAVLHVAPSGADNGNVACDAGTPSYVVPRIGEVRGCERLREWWNAMHASRETTSHTAADVRERTTPNAVASGHGVDTWIASHTQKLFWFAGKGGTGKSTCAAAFAQRLSRTRAVLLCSTDPAGSLREVLDMPVDGEAVDITDTFRVRQVDAAAELDAWRGRYREEADAMFEQLGVGGSATLDRKIMAAIWDAVPPGIDELFALSEIIDAAEDERTIVVDAAPTGHFLRLIESPDMALEWTHAILRILLKYGAAGALEGFSSRVLAFAKQLKHLSSLLTDPAACGVFVVTTEEPVVRVQTERLRESLARAGIAVSALIVNRAGDTMNQAPDTVAAPLLDTPPVGLPALGRFIESWVFA